MQYHKLYHCQILRASCQDFCLCRWDRSVYINIPYRIADIRKSNELKQACQNPWKLLMEINFNGNILYWYILFPKNKTISNQFSIVRLSTYINPHQQNMIGNVLFETNFTFSIRAKHFSPLFYSLNNNQNRVGWPVLMIKWLFRRQTNGCRIYLI